MQALQTKKTKVVNPWIHGQTHHEYLDKIIGLPARHANVIRKHKFVIKETMFLPKADSNFDKDKATKEALAILEKEYEIFNDPNMPPVKAFDSLRYVGLRSRSRGMVRTLPQPP